MNNKKQEASCLTGWSVNAHEENLTPRVSIEAVRMLHTSRLYLRVEATKMGSDLSHLVRTDLSSETLTAR